MINKNTLALMALCIGFFMVIIDVMIVNVALPTMAKELGGGIAWLQWVVDGYTLTFACLLLSAGHVGDQFGAKKAFLLGLAFFVLTSFACGVATNFLMLTIFRMLQGISAALLVPTSLALINSSYENKQQRAKAIGIWGGIAGIAAAMGPILGAFLTAWLGWRAVFFVNVPLGLLGFFLTRRYVKNPAAIIRQNKEFDVTGQLFAIIGIAALAFGLIEAGRLGWLSAVVMSSFIIFLLTFIIFIFIELRTRAPMFPLKLFRDSTFSAAIAVGMLMNVAFYGILFIMPLYFQELRGYSVLMTGFALLPLCGIASIGSYLGGRLTSMKGPRSPMLIGSLIATLGYFALLIIGEHTPAYLILILPFAAVGFGGSFLMPAATVAAIHTVADNRTGMASGAFNASRQVGSLLGVAIFGTIINLSVHFIFGMHVSFVIGGSAFLIGCILTFLFIRKN